MTPEQAREAFDDAFEGELSAEARAAFDAALAGDAALAVEWDEFQRTMRMVRGVGLDEAEPAGRNEVLVDAVHRKLRVRSRGRFYRDRFSTLRRDERVLPIVLAIVAFLLVAIAWAGHRVVEIAPATQAPR